ncbi:MAG: hypothetical protein IT515_12640 [Burkholderiales bacterium]|nr:hypothetical protein [Burkholderiales bacterium]
MMVKGWIWRALLAGVAGSLAHSLLMYFKSRTGLLPSFQPYQSLQLALSHWVGREVPVIVPWALSFLNGATILGFLFARVNRLLPGGNGAVKGLVFGLLGWLMMGLLVFPLLGLGLFAVRTGAGIAPALFSLAMLLAYSVVLGTVYAALGSAER